MPEWIDAVKLTWLAVGVLIGWDLALVVVAIARHRGAGHDA